MLIECEKCRKIVASHAESCRAINFPENHQKQEQVNGIIHREAASPNHNPNFEEEYIDTSECDNSWSCNGSSNAFKQKKIQSSYDSFKSEENLQFLTKEELIEEIRLLTLLVNKVKRENARLKEKNFRLQEDLPLAINQLKEISSILKLDKPVVAEPPWSNGCVEIVETIPSFSVSVISPHSVDSVEEATKISACSDIVKDHQNNEALNIEAKSSISDNIDVSFSKSSAPIDLGHGIIIESRHVKRIESAYDYKRLVCYMVDIMFDKQEIMASSVSGQARHPCKPKPALDPYRVNSLINFVLSKFPSTKPAAIKHRISQKLRDARKWNKKKNVQSRIG